MSDAPTTNKRLGIIAACITAFCWSFLAIVLKVALSYTDPNTIVFYRMGFAFLIMLTAGVVYYRDLIIILKHWPILGVLAGLGLGINYLGYMKGIELTSPSNAQIFIQFAPLLLVVSGIIFFKERPKPHQYFGLVFTFVGFALFFSDQFSQLEDSKTYLEGNLWIFISAITWAAFASFQKKATSHWTLGQLNLLISFVATLLLAPGVPWDQFSQISFEGHLILMFLGLNTVIAYGCFAVALKNLPASQVSPIITLNPLLTLVFMFLLEWANVSWIEPDSVKPLGYFGAILVVSGVILAVRTKPFRIKTSST